jgi:hypothetical protein
MSWKALVENPMRAMLECLFPGVLRGMESEAEERFMCGGPRLCVPGHDNAGDFSPVPFYFKTNRFLCVNAETYNALTYTASTT